MGFPLGKAGTNSQRTKSRISSFEASYCHTGAVRKKPAQSPSAPQAEIAGIRAAPGMLDSNGAQMGGSEEWVCHRTQKERVRQCVVLSIFYAKCAMLLSYWCKMLKIAITRLFYLQQQLYKLRAINPGNGPS